MGNTVSSDHVDQKPGQNRGLRTHFSKRRGKTRKKPPAAEVPAEQHKATPPAAQALLEVIKLGIYTDAFLLAGWGSRNAADLAALTEADLDQIQLAAKVPILPHHQRLILAASKQLGLTLGITSPLASPAPGSPRPDGAAAAPPAAHAASASAQRSAGQLLPAASGTREHSSGTAAAPFATPGTSRAEGQHPEGCQQHAAAAGQQRSQQQEPANALAYAPCPLMNPFLGQGSDSNSLSGAVRHDAPSTVTGGSDSTTVVTAAGKRSSSGVMHPAAAGSSRESSQHNRQQGIGDSAPVGSSDPGGSSFATARSESRGSISGSEAADPDAPGSSGGCHHADQAMLQQSQQQGSPWQPAAAAGTDSDEAAQPEGKASSGAVCCPAALPGLSEIEPADLSPRSSSQQGRGAATAGSWPAADTSAARKQEAVPLVRHQREPSLGELLFGCATAAPAESGAAAPAGTAAGAAAGRADCWFEDLDDDLPGRDDSNPFLVPDAMPAPAQHSTARQPAVTLSPVCEDGMSGDPYSPGGYLQTAAEPSAAAFGRSAASTPGPNGGLSGPLTSSRAQLLRPSSAASWRASTTLSDPAVTAAAAAQLAGYRRRPGPHSTAWEKLPGQVASLSYAKTASLKTYPLPALAAVASGQPRKQRGPVEAQEPGVLTLNASQLPQRPVSESGYCMRSVQGYGYGYGRFPGLRAEESNASAAAALQQLSMQQANNQELIQRLLHGPTAPADAAARAAGAAGMGFTAAGPLNDAGHEFDQGPVRSYTGRGNRSGYSGGLQGPAVLGPQAAAAAAARGSILGSEHSVLLVQQPHQLFAQYSSSGGGSFLAPVPVAVAGWAGGAGSQQGQQLLLLSGQDLGPAAGAGAAVVTAGTLHLSEPLTGMQQQRLWQEQDVNSRSARMQAHGGRTGFTSMSAQHSSVYDNYRSDSAWAARCAGDAGGRGMPAAAPAGDQGSLQQDGSSYLLQQRSAASLGMAASPGGLSGAQSCIELGSRAADVGNIVLRAKAKAAAKQQLLQNQQQQAREPQVTPTTPLLGNSVLDALAAGQQLKGAAAMLVGKPARPRPAGRPQVPASAQPQHSMAAAAASSSKDQGKGPLGAAASRGPTGASRTAAADAAAADPAPRNSLAAAVRDGDKVLQMLQEYKELAELDKAVKSRMRELLHTAAVPGSAAASLPPGSAATAAAPAPANPAATAGQAQAPAIAPRAAAAAAATAAAAVKSEGTAGRAETRRTNTASSAVQQAKSEAVIKPCTDQTSSAAEPAGYTGPADAQIQGSMPNDQAAAVQQVDEDQQQHRDSPAKAAGQSQPHSDQQQKLAGLHRSPKPKAARAAASTAAAATGCSFGGPVTDADVSAEKRKAARQLWQPSSNAPSGSGGTSKGAGGAPAASAAAAGDPTTRVLAAAGLAAGPQVQGQVQKGKGGASVAALVAALAGRRTK